MNSGLIRSRGRYVSKLPFKASTEILQVQKSTSGHALWHVTRSASPAHFPAVPHCKQHPAKNLGKAAEDGLSPGTPPAMWDTEMKLLNQFW